MFFFPASKLAGLNLLLTLWRITAFLLRQICILSFPSPSTYANHPPLGSFPLLPGSWSRKDLRISSHTALCLWKDCPASDLPITFPRGDHWRGFGCFFPLRPLLSAFHFGTGSPHTSGHRFWAPGFATLCHRNMLQGGYFPGGHSMPFRISCSRRKQVPPSLQKSRGWNH